MATKFTIKRHNGSSWVELYPVTSYNNLVDVPSSFTPSTHTHSQYLTGITKSMVTTALGYTPPTTDTNTWRGIQNNLTSTSTTDSLSAAQGKVLKDAIDAINTALSSDDTDLDTIQEIVSYIKANKTTIDSITTSKQPKTLATALTINGTSRTTVEDALSALNTYIGTKTANTGTVTSITLSAGGGISLNATGAITTSGTRTITNTGVRSVSTGTANGTISVNTNGTSANVSVYGLGTAAYTNSSAYAASGHTHALISALESLTSSNKDTVGFVKVDNSGNWSVDNNTYLTSHQSLSNYSTKANTIKSLSISGKTITYTKGDDTTGTLTTQDTNTTYSAGTGLSLSSTTFSLASGVATAGTAGTSSATSGSTLAVPYVTVDTYGRVTGYGTHTHTISGFSASGHTHTKSQITDFPTSMPASDVYSWAKASVKPSYEATEIATKDSTVQEELTAIKTLLSSNDTDLDTLQEIVTYIKNNSTDIASITSNKLDKSGGTMTGNLIIGDGANALLWRSNALWASGVYYHTNGDESVVFANKKTSTSWIFANTDPVKRTNWRELTPGLQIKNNKVAINKLIDNGTEGTYTLDVNGTANATTIYENGTSLTDKYAALSHTHTKSQITDFPTSLPANGGISTYTLKMQTYKAGSTTETYGTSYPLYAQWANSTNLDLKCDGYLVRVDALKSMNISQFTNDSGYLTTHQDISGKQDKITSSNKLAYSLISGTPSSLPASDVYSWAKASSKPSYSFTGTAATSGANSGTAVSAAPSGHTHSVTASGTVSLGSNTTAANGIAYVEPSVSGTTLTLTVKYFHPSFSGTAVTSGSNSGTAVSAAPSGHTHSVTATGSVS